MAQKGGYFWKRIRYRPALTRCGAWLTAKRKDWEMLKQWAQQGLIRLKYLDESGCTCVRSPEYSYAQRGVQKSIRQCPRRSRRINILGVWEPGVQFDYALMVGTLKAPTYVQLMEWQANKAQKHFDATGQITVIVQDNASVHRSQLAQLQVQRWQALGLFLFFLPPYSPQMNRIEDEWLHLKRDELSARVFEDEYDLALAIQHGIQARGKRTNYQIERFIFN